jgi:hypothetical protein
MSALGQKRTSHQVRVMSALPAEADIERESKGHAWLQVASSCLPRGRKRLHSAVPNRVGGARGGKKFDQSFRTGNVSRAGDDGG